LGVGRPRAGFFPARRGRAPALHPRKKHKHPRIHPTHSLPSAPNLPNTFPTHPPNPPPPNTQLAVEATHERLTVQVTNARILTETLRTTTDTACPEGGKSPAAWLEVKQLTNTSSIPSARALCSETIAGAVGYLICTEQRGEVLVSDMASGKVAWNDLCKVARQVRARKRARKREGDAGRGWGGGGGLFFFVRHPPHNKTDGRRPPPDPKKHRASASA
jgi:hypothetical protein